jgi:hypothetical protein
VTRRLIIPKTLGAAVAALALSACSYGPLVDNSGFEAAVPAPNGTCVLAAYRIERYRPAQGVAAFPDGGIPSYEEDRIVVAAIPVRGGPVRILQRLPNPGLPGSAHVGLRAQPGDPTRVLVTHSDQPSTATAINRVRRWRLDPSSGETLAVADVAAELAAKGRTLGAKEFGDLRVIDPAGALLVGATGAQGEELWARSADGGWRNLGPLTHFYGVLGDEVYLWSVNAAVVRNWRTGAERVIARYDPQIRQTATLIRGDPTVVAIEQRRDGGKGPQVSVDGQAILVDGHPIPVDLATLRR